jgi:hypothetical protein
MHFEEYTTTGGGDMGCCFCSDWRSRSDIEVRIALRIREHLEERGFAVV